MENSDEIKRQLIENIKKLNIENKEQVIEYVTNLDDEQLEEFLKKNKIQVTEQGLSQESPEAQKGADKCIFCQITQSEIPSYKIAENNKSMAILELNPLSKGHALVLPKAHYAVEKIPKTSMSLAQKIAKKIKKKLKPDDIKIETSSFQGHAFINIIPLYKNAPLKKEKAEDAELKELKNKLETKSREKRAKPQKVIIDTDDGIPEITFRIP